MSFNNAFGYGQPKAASRLLCPGHAPEPIKDLQQMFLRNAWSCICYRYHNFATLLMCGHADRALLGRELDGISDQVGNHLPDAASINFSIRKVRMYIGFKCLPLGFDLGQYTIDYRHHYITQPFSRWDNREGSALNFCEIEKIAD